MSDLPSTRNSFDFSTPSDQSGVHQTLAEQASIPGTIWIALICWAIIDTTIAKAIWKSLAGGNMETLSFYAFLSIAIGLSIAGLLRLLTR